MTRPIGLMRIRRRRLVVTAWAVLISCACLSPRASAAPGSAPVQVGLEVLEADAAALQGRKVGLVVTPGSVTADGRHSIDVLRKAGVNVVRLLAHERALRTRSAVWDKVSQNLDGTTFLGRPQVESGRRLDARFFTVMGRLQQCMEAAAEAEIEFIVLDRRWLSSREVPKGPGEVPPLLNSCANS